MRGLHVATLALTLACDAKPEPAPSEARPAPVNPPAPAPSPPNEALPAPEVAAPKFDPELGQRFTSAASGLAIAAAASPSESGPRWRAPDCALEYEFRISVGNDPTGKLDNAMLIAGGWTVRAAPPGMILQNGEIRFTQMLGGTARQAEGSPRASLAEIRLQTDGRAWTEVDGPTALWSAYGTWAGLTKFFPALPESAAPGSEADWLLTIYDRSAGGRVEGARGTLEIPEGTTLPEPEATELHARVSLERWIEVDGTRAAELRSWFEHLADDAAGSDDLRIDERTQAQFVVLESGVLLHAELRERSEIRMGSGERAMTQHVVLDGEARLVRGCGGPALPRFED